MMAYATRIYIPRIIRAKTDTNVAYFANKAAVAFDLNPDTFEKALSLYCQIAFDGDATRTTTSLPYTATWAGIWIHNYAAAFSGAAQAKVWSTTDPAYGAPNLVLRGILYFTSLYAESGLLVGTITATTDRYWLFEFQGLAVLLELGMAMIGTYVDVTARSDWAMPINYLFRHGVRHFNLSEECADGTTIARTMRSRGAETFVRSYEFLDKANYEALSTAHDLARGSFSPVVIADDNQTGMNAHRLVRFSADKLEPREVANQLYNLSISMNEVPFKIDGQAY